MIIGPLEFRPQWPITLLTLVVAGLLGSLGNWQLERASEKELLLAQRERYADATPVSLTGEMADPEALRLRPVQSRGSYLPERQLLLDNQIENGRVGYQVLTPFVLEGGDTAVLVNRGWVPMGATRQDIPAIAVGAELRGIEGLANNPPQVGMRLGSGADQGFWPRVIQYVDPEELAWVLRRPLLPIVVQLDPTEADGYVREWKVVSFGPERHRGYAFQWFSLMAAVVVLYLALNLRRRKQSSGNDSEGDES